jgi:hypothetical protein
MIFELDDDLPGFCKGDKIGPVSIRLDAEVGKAVTDAWPAGLRDEGRPAPGATEGENVRQAKRKTDKIALRRDDRAYDRASPLPSWRLDL